MQVCCRACGDILTYEKNDTNPLVQHIRAKHPEKNLVCLPAVYADQDAKKSKENGKAKTAKKDKNGDQNASDAETDDLKTNPSSHMNFSGSKYKYTVHYYGHSKKLIKCPQCSKEMYPVLKQKTNRTLPSLFRALFYLICWPINFLPFLICGKKEYHLYCTKCQKKIGSQDRNGEIILTNGKEKKEQDKEGEEVKENEGGEEEEEEEEEGGEDDDEDQGGGGGGGGEGGGGGAKEEEKKKEPEKKEKKEEPGDKKNSRYSYDEDDDKDARRSEDDGSDDSQLENRMMLRELKDKERKTKEMDKGKQRTGRRSVRHKENFNNSISSVPLGRILGRKSGKLLR